MARSHRTRRVRCIRDVIKLRFRNDFHKYSRKKITRFIAERNIKRVTVDGVGGGGGPREISNSSLGDRHLWVYCRPLDLVVSTAKIDFYCALSVSRGTCDVKDFNFNLCHAIITKI